ncbi:MAG TPA: LppX_LprAFG lipoprotein [Aggregatilineales bacterium]|nr:LppX_LprAFG lipoprotein [Aggregatilineales bacterium]
MNRHALFILLLLLLTACNRDDKNDSDNDNASVDTAALIEAAAQKIDDASAFQLELVVNGAPVFLDGAAIDLDVPVTFQRAEGVFVAPDSLGGEVTILLEDDVTAEVKLIAIGEDQYLQHPLITFNQWEAITFSPNFNPATLVEGDESIPAALRTMSAVEYVGVEDIDGINMHHIRGEVEVSRVSAVTVGLIGTTEGVVKGDIYIRERDGLLERMILEEPINPEIDPDQPSIWTIGLYDYNGDYTVTRPDIQE